MHHVVFSGPSVEIANKTARDLIYLVILFTTRRAYIVSPLSLNRKHCDILGEMPLERDYRARIARTKMLVHSQSGILQQIFFKKN